jgi:hypothetical protein
MLGFYRDLISARQRHKCLANCSKELTKVVFDEELRWITLRRSDEDGSAALLVCNLSDNELSAPVSEKWKLEMWSGAPHYGGTPGLVAPPVTAEREVILSPWNGALFMLTK